jgi:hypothetical protein
MKTDIGFELELDRVRDVLRHMDGVTPGVISAIARMPVVRVFACLTELDKRQLAFRELNVDKWWST